MMAWLIKFNLHLLFLLAVCLGGANNELCMQLLLFQPGQQGQFIISSELFKAGV